MEVQRLSQWAKTRAGTDISLYFYGASDLSLLKNHSLWIGGVHGDEPEGVYLAEEILKWLQTQAQRNLPLKPFALIPCLNPDGYAKNQRTNSEGIDLNRNFPAKNWQLSEKKDRYYSGESPGCAEEIRAVTALIEATSPNYIAHCHSWKPCVVVSGPQDLEEARWLSEASGYPIVPDIGYPTPGSLSSYGWLDRRVPVICTEEAEGQTRNQTWQRFRAAIEKIFSEAAQ